MLLTDVREMFILGFSFNFYMFQGGTNFGLMGGASSSNGYLPVVTSYGKYLVPRIISNLGCFLAESETCQVMPLREVSSSVLSFCVLETEHLVFVCDHTRSWCLGFL